MLRKKGGERETEKIIVKRRKGGQRKQGEKNKQVAKPSEPWADSLSYK